MAVTEGPCLQWAIDTSCCSSWETLDPAVQAKATTMAIRSLWAKTGRRYDQCSQVVRPCGKDCSGSCGGNMYWSGGTWYPYIMNGIWRNCWCGDSGPCCTCRPTQQVYLPGPVTSVSQVNVDGVVVPVDNYRVDDMRWLVGLNGQVWPECANFDVSTGTGFFQVTYIRGIAPPPDLLAAAGILACEYAAFCTGAACRLPRYATTVSRSGVEFTLPDPQDLLSMGLTGLFEVDQVIMDLNPYGLKAPPLVLSPELAYPRTTTWP